MSDEQARDEQDTEEEATGEEATDEEATDEEEDTGEDELSQDEDRSGGDGSPESRLEAVDEQIRRAREQARETLDLPDEQEVHDSGDTPEEDDQAIAPPG